MAWSLTNADVITALPILADFYEKADGGSTTTLTCKRLTSLQDDEIVGATIGFISGDNAGTDAVVSTYASATTATFGFDAVSGSVDSSTGFGITLISWKVYIDRAFSIIKNELRNKDLDIDLFKTVSQVKELHLLKTVELICLSKRQDANADDVFHESYLSFKEAYSGEMLAIRADYDLDEDGTLEESEKLQSSNRVVLGK